MKRLKMRMQMDNFNSYTMDFCVNEGNMEEEVGRMRKFLAIKIGVNEATEEDVRRHLEGQVKRYPEVEELPEGAGYTERCMRGIVDGEKKALKMCLLTVTKKLIVSLTRVMRTEPLARLP